MPSANASRLCRSPKTVLPYILLKVACFVWAILILGPAANRTLAEQTTPVNIVRYKTVSVRGIRIFYREAGDVSKPALLLLHGFPSSSNEFRMIIPLLSSQFHVIAPDYPGFGFSDAPPESRFTPNFEELSATMTGFIQTIGLRKFTLYVHDFGGPVGFRIAVAHPDWIEGLIIQNANAYEIGIAPAMLEAMKSRASGPLKPHDAADVDQVLSLEGTKYQYLTGVGDPEHVDPTSYNIDSWIQTQPEQHRIQRALVTGYYENVLQYSTWHSYFKVHQPRTLILWGKNDPIFLAAGATAYKDDLPMAKIEFLDTGHFALEVDSSFAADQIIKMFGH